MASALQQQQFVQQWSPYATQAGAALGVSPSIILGQWANESGWGTNSGALTGNNVGGIMQPGTQTQQSFTSPQAFTNAYVSTVSNNFPGALNAGNDTGAFVGGLASGGSSGQLVYFGNASQAGSYQSSIASNAATVSQINPQLATGQFAQGPTDSGLGGSTVFGGGTGTTSDPYTFNMDVTPGTTPPASSTPSLGGVAGDPGILPPASTGGLQETGLSGPTVSSITGWINGIESAVGGAFKSAWSATVGQVENLALRFMIVLAAIAVIIVALWRLLDPDGSKVVTMVKSAAAA